MFYKDDGLKQKYHKEFAEIFISKGFGEDGETVEDIIDILKSKSEGRTFVITDEGWIPDNARAINISGNIFISPGDMAGDIECKSVIFYEIFHTLISDKNRNGLEYTIIKEDFSEEVHGEYANEGAINCIVSEMLDLEYSGKIQNIDTKPIKYKIKGYAEAARVMEQVDFFVGSKCLVKAMRFDPQILNDKFDKIAEQEGAFASIRDNLDSIKDIEDKIDIKMTEYENAKEKGDNAYMQYISQEIGYHLDGARQEFQAAQAIIIYNCFGKKIKEADSPNQVNAIINEVDKFESLGLAENSDSFNNYLRTVINQKSANYSEIQLQGNTNKESFKNEISDAIKDIRQGEFNDISNNMKEDLLLKQEKQSTEEKEGENR